MKALLLATVVAIALVLSACSDSSDITGINTGRACPLGAGPQAEVATTNLALTPHRIAQPAPTPFVAHERCTPTPTAVPTSKP